METEISNSNHQRINNITSLLSIIHPGYLEKQTIKITSLAVREMCNQNKPEVVRDLLNNATQKIKIPVNYLGVTFEDNQTELLIVLLDYLAKHGEVLAINKAMIHACRLNYLEAVKTILPYEIAKKVEEVPVYLPYPSIDDRCNRFWGGPTGEPGPQGAVGCDGPYGYREPYQIISLAEACYHNNFEIVDYLLDFPFYQRYTYDILLKMCKQRKIRAINFILEKTKPGYRIIKEIIKNITYRRNEEIIELLINHIEKDEMKKMFCLICKKNTYDDPIEQWMLEKYPEIKEEMTVSSFISIFLARSVKFTSTVILENGLAPAKENGQDVIDQILDYHQSLTDKSSILSLLLEYYQPIFPLNTLHSFRRESITEELSKIISDYTKNSVSPVVFYQKSIATISEEPVDGFTSYPDGVWVLGEYTQELMDKLGAAIKRPKRALA